MASFDPDIEFVERSNIRVCLRDNPGRHGLTTGRVKRPGTRVMIEVEFGPNDRQFKDRDVLEPVCAGQDFNDLIHDGRFGTPSDLRRVLIYEKIKGDLTNIFYSMESSNTDFYPHQFKPVLNFVESTIGRLLIADEVGLGKTIEATYIWKELQARENARRLLIVCPAMLREKWRRDLRKRFNIPAEIVDASALLRRLSDLAHSRIEDAFVYIVGLEGARIPRDYDDASNDSVRAQLGRLLDDNPATPEFGLLDLVIIDEAHYLRNPETSNNRLGRLLRDAAQHLVLLTATPIQLGNENLYQLLRLLDPDEFSSAYVFDSLTAANGHIVRSQRALWQQPPNIDAAIKGIRAAQQTEYFSDDKTLGRIEQLLLSASLDNQTRIEALRLLESRSLLSHYMTRSRKREVMKDRVERSAQVLSLEFAPVEKTLYDHVSQNIRERAEGQSTFALFPLFTRQRQMASSIVGALESWKETGVVQELLEEDLGILLDPLESGPQGVADAAADIGPGNFDLQTLEQIDSKYERFRTFLARQISLNPREKFVVFAFFKGTLRYLHKRLGQDGIRSLLLHGSTNDDKDSVVDSFATETGPNVLLSSEVGSEGIDLQFCRFVVNYDLPWNPMRVEQRIGRLDRLGQRAERISVVNLKIENTIEDRIIMRLYDRIQVFRESIGDLEDILGDITPRLISDFFNPRLTDAEREQKADENALAVAHTHEQQKNLEAEAVNLVGFTDYILENINESRDIGRWLSGDDLIQFVDDFFAYQYPGTHIENLPDPLNRAISLSEQARQSLGNFITRERSGVRTRLHQTAQPVVCVFDPRRSTLLPERAEFIDPVHPLVQWIKDSYTNDVNKLHRISAVSLTGSQNAFESGLYVFYVQKWSFQGMRAEGELTYAAVRLGSDDFMTPRQAEQLVIEASRFGKPIPNPANSLPDSTDLATAIRLCEEWLDVRYGRRLDDFEAENSVRCKQQETSARKYADRRIADLRQRIVRFELLGQPRMIPATEGLIRREGDTVNEKLARIHTRRQVDHSTSQLSAGFIMIE